MADDLDGVSLSSSVPEYHPGNQYRVKEMDPDEAGGGKDFYDGFMRRKKKQEEGEGEDAEGPAEEQAEISPENPIPVVEQEIHDDIILSSKAKQILEQQDDESDRPDSVDADAGTSAGRINFQA